MVSKHPRFWAASIALCNILVLSISGAPAGAADQATTTPPSESSTQLKQMDQRLDEADKQIDALRKEVQRLRAAQKQSEISVPATAPAATQPVRPAPQAVQGDQGKSKDLKPIIAGYDGNHFFIGSADGRYKLSLEGQIDVRYIYNNRDNPTDDDDDVQGFQLRAAKIAFTGHIGDPKLSYKIKGEFSRNGGAMKLEDAWIAYDFDKQWRVKIGQFGGISLREYNISSKSQQAVERSTVTRYFDEHSTKGIMVNYNTDRWHHGAQFTAGPDQGGTDFTTSSHNYEWSVSGRSEYLISGNWKQFDDFAAWSKEPFGLMAGAGFMWDKGANYSGATNADLLKYTADLSAKLGNGINLFGAFVGQHVYADSGEPSPDGDQYGLVVQTGAFVVPDKLDIFIRYAYADLKGAAVDNEDASVTAIQNDIINTLTIGTNYYFNKHRAKLTFDVVYALDPVDSSFASTATGLLPDLDRGQIALRTQFQLLF